MTPTTCKKLLDAGYQVTVERSTQRIFDGWFLVPLSSMRCNVVFGYTDVDLLVDNEFAEVYLTLSLRFLLSESVSYRRIGWSPSSR